MNKISNSIEFFLNDKSSNRNERAFEFLILIIAKLNRSSIILFVTLLLEIESVNRILKYFSLLCLSNNSLLTRRKNLKKFIVT